RSPWWFPLRKPDAVRRGRRRWTTAAFMDCLPARLAPLTTETATVSAAAATLALGTSFIDVQSATSKIRAVQAGDGPVGFLGIAHFDKRKAAGAAGITIRDQIDTINCSIPLEHLTHRRIGGGKIQIAYENILHFFTLFCLSIVRARQGRSGQPSSGGTIKRHPKCSTASETELMAWIRYSTWSSDKPVGSVYSYYT